MMVFRQLFQPERSTSLEQTLINLHDSLRLPMAAAVMDDFGCEVIGLSHPNQEIHEFLNEATDWSEWDLSS
jgi:hypothetical protein